jgi:hypothetical protein
MFNVLSHGYIYRQLFKVKFQSQSLSLKLKAMLWDYEWMVRFRVWCELKI